ncbi:hypothetical protein [uncultured Endozoicomonas sp.]|uniref:hypothetical protein n=1 Tax=uncultured Endozoicomonas sp. TaxID=432652 RepID=UPI0026353B20|nr:hypothetical protein [uncultured Endozoicomonas sp.]
MQPVPVSSQRLPLGNLSTNNLQGRKSPASNGSAHQTLLNDIQSKKAKSLDGSLVKPKLLQENQPPQGQTPQALQTRNIKPAAPGPDSVGNRDIPPTATDPLSEQKPLGNGMEQLQRAQDAFTAHAQLTVCKDAIESLEMYVAVCKQPYTNTAALLEALQKIDLPPNAKKTKLNVNLQEGVDTLKHLPSISLIPIDKANLGKFTCKEVLEKYTLAFHGMKQWQQENRHLGSLDEALAKLNSSLEALIGIQKRINEEYRKKNPSNGPPVSQLEMRYNEHTQKGVSINGRVDNSVLEAGAEDIGQKPPQPEAENQQQAQPPQPANQVAEAD